MSEVYPASVVEWARARWPASMVETLDQLIAAKEIVIKEEGVSNVGNSKN